MTFETPPSWREKPAVDNGQTRRASAAEAVANVVAGAVLSLILQFYVFPLYGWSPPLQVNLKIMAWFTVASLLRSYGMRRFFNLFR